jgi:hypothetical protein
MQKEFLLHKVAGFVFFVGAVSSELKFRLPVLTFSFQNRVKRY